MSTGKILHRRRVTLHDVARAANVSAMTVSNVVNGRVGTMRSQTLGLVRKAIQDLDYRPSAAGRSLRLQASRLIGLVIIDDKPDFLADPFDTYIVAGLSNALHEEGYGLVVLGCSIKALDQSLLARRRETDAICIIPSGAPATRRRLYAQLRDVRQPLLVFQCGADILDGDCATFRQDDEGGAQMLAERLLARGARRIGFTYPRQPWPAIEARRQGILRALRRSGVKARLLDAMAQGEGLDETVAALEAAFGDTVPDAVMAANDQMGIATLRWAEQRGLTVPRDLKVTGFNAFPFREYSRPILTSIRSAATEMGRLGGRAIVDRLRSGTFPVRETLLSVALVEGESD